MKYTAGPRFRQLRKKAGWTAKELATHVGLAPSFISDVERGNRMFTYRLLEKSIPPLNMDDAEINEMLNLVRQDLYARWVLNGADNYGL